MKLSAVLLFLMASGVVSAHPPCQVDQASPEQISSSASCMQEKEVRHRLEVLAKSGDAIAASRLADYYLDSDPPDDINAIYWLRQYARNAKTDGSILLGQLLIRSPKPVDVTEGLAILKKHALTDDVRAGEVLGRYFRTSDPQQAVKWFSFSAARGSQSSAIALSEIMLASDIPSERAIGALWALVASETLSKGSFEQVKLTTNALKAITQFGGNQEAFKSVAKSIARSMATKEKK